MAGHGISDVPLLMLYLLELDHVNQIESALCA